ncbi:MAG: Rrf2 family transcriptional regulator [bacterium]
MDILGKLLGNPNRVKTIRLFLFNPDLALTAKDVAKRSKVSLALIRKELRGLRESGFIKEKRSVRGGYQLNKEFPFQAQLRILFNVEVFENREKIVKRFKNCGRIRSLIISGIFLEDGDGKVDLVVIGDKLKRTPIENAVRAIEAEIGKELTYAVLETKDFIYRLHSGDKFVRDVLDFEHKRLIDKLVF